MKTIVINKNDILSSVKVENDMFSLTDLWKLAGSPKNKKPKFWLRQESTTQLIETLCVVLKGDSKSPLEITKFKRGNNGGSYAHKSIALAYAKYLDPKLHLLVNKVFFERIEEEANPDAIVDRAIRTYERKGMSPQWIAKRLHAKGIRNQFTTTLRKHGVMGDGYKVCTNAIYMGLFGDNATGIRARRHLPAKCNLRENLSSLELSAISLSEELAMEDITNNRKYGNEECSLSSNLASRIVAQSINKFRSLK